MGKENNKTNNIKSQNSSKQFLGYHGIVKVGLMKNNKLYSVKTFKNAGRWPLFYFFTSCLAGSYEDVDSLRPKFIDLFNYTGSGTNDCCCAKDFYGVSGYNYRRFRFY